MKCLYALLALVPVAMLLEWVLHASAPVIFAVSSLALIPLAAVLGKATEEIAIHTGPRVGGLLNATLGNAAELIITIVALNAGLYTLVKASLVGSILGNILVVLGLSLLLGGLKNGIQRFDGREAGIVSALLLLSVIAMGVPTIFSRSIPEEADVVFLSDEVAFIMLLMYLAYLAYSFFGSADRAAPAGGGHGTASMEVPPGGAGQQSAVVSHEDGTMQSARPAAATGGSLVRPQRR